MAFPVGLLLGTAAVFAGCAVYSWRMRVYRNSSRECALLAGVLVVCAAFVWRIG